MKVRMLSNDEIEAIGLEARRTGNEPVFQLANEVMGVRSRVRGGEIMAESMISAKDGRGRVRITWHDEEAFLDIDIATGLGQSIVEAACAARIDAAFTAVAVSQFGLTHEQLTPLLTAIRAARRMDDARPPS